jgi:magnesium transporter
MASRRRSQKIGLSPGSLVYLGDSRQEPARFSIIDYGVDYFHRHAAPEIEDCVKNAAADTVRWINISGIHDVAAIGRLQGAFGIHPLVLEDIVNTGHRPKIDDYDDYVFIVFKMLYSEPGKPAVKHEQVSLIVGNGYVISLQEVGLDIFDPLRERIKLGRGRIRTQGSDYLAYTLLDTVVDHYFKVLEELGERIEDLEDTVIQAPVPETLAEIQDLKREMLHIRTSLWPMREVIGTLLRGESKVIGKKVNLYFRDVYDHTIHAIDTVELFRDMLSAILDIYLSSVGNKMNEVMKVLTVMATIFIPMTFLAGVYGMNFDYMPELHWKSAYPAFWLLMVVILIGMVIFFKRNKWL